MRREEPFFKKCCYVVPLSVCLQIWAFIKMLAAFVGMMIFLFLLLLIVSVTRSNGHAVSEYAFFILLVLMVVTLLVDAGFNIMLMVAVCKKNTKLMRVFYFYDLYVIVMESVALIGLLVCLYLHKMNKTAFVFVGCGLPFIILDICILFTLKSEMIKLRNKEQYDFTKIQNTTTDLEEFSVKFTPEENV